MTSIDPSHFASLGVGSSDTRTHGAATHPVRVDNLVPSPSSSDLDEDENLPSPTSSFFDPKDLPHRLSAIHLPDLRFEQGYLMSLMPFFHFDHAKPLDKQKQPADDSPRSSQPYVFGQDDLVPKEASDATSTEADNYYFGPNFRVEWKMVVYVTLRDQLLYPLIQGCLWGSASLVLSHFWRIRANRRPKPTREIAPESLDPIHAKRGTIWDRFIGSMWGGIQTNVTLS
ncbi:hypothetical protein PTTG_28690 [Puccinia triticina 1-1 BBBD Race 1]|uniref:Uncharacterized protein n=2 Tax=Puccinia triticina TaxID=208348 RepID=A0A180GAC4_PUCT1|nr:uncharacterized protein PtA15_3A649 [Puccinia triticina]OAV89439.1 hypothetical protein PTTG_28690 [Puccinia triticina 1-1 BBBD Race 1]WAQ83280.1 hypothetical protein PtA15_3A649 [Puccinia triticina]WAR54128.1 hypothetical protein PtB15_3B640 [Puccinia triticina]